MSKSHSENFNITPEIINSSHIRNSGDMFQKLKEISMTKTHGEFWYFYIDSFNYICFISTLSGWGIGLSGFYWLSVKQFFVGIRISSNLKVHG